MWNKIAFSSGRCTNAEQWLEDAASSPAASVVIEDLRASLSSEQRDHLQHCADCQTALREFADSKALLRFLGRSPAEAPPFFAKRVMAAIAVREGELERAARAWALVPKLASRFAGIATILLLIGGAWAYEGPLHKSPNPAAQTAQPAAETGTQLFEDNATVPANRDDVLVSLLERGE